MKDVYFLKNRQGIWVFKALTDKAKEEMRKLLDLPPAFGEEVFMHANDNQFNFLRNALVRSGLTLESQEDPKPKREVDVRSYTEF